MFPLQNLIEKIDDGAVYVNYEEDQVTSKKRKMNEHEIMLDEKWDVKGLVMRFCFFLTFSIFINYASTYFENS